MSQQDVRRAVLAAAKTDQDALKAKCFALIMMGRHVEALEVAHLPQMANCLHLERAYCIWKVTGTNAALAELGETAGEGEQHLKALLLMLVGRSDEALKMLEGLLQGAKGDKQAVCELVCHMLLIFMSISSGELPADWLTQGAEGTCSTSLSLGRNSYCISVTPHPCT